MKTTIYTILIILILSSCNKETKGNMSLKPNNEMLKIMDSFVAENYCEDCIYELYIDKIDPHIYTTILYTGKQSLTDEENFNNQQEAVNIAKTTNGTIFKIYTGIEYYFRKKSNNLKIEKNDEYDTTKNAILIVKDSFGKLTTIKQSYAYPFMPLPLPDVSIKDIIMTKDTVK